LSIELWLPEGIHEEHTLKAEGGRCRELTGFPYKWFHLDIYNEGPDEVKIMVNKQTLPAAITLEPYRSREYDAKHPKYWRVAVYAEPGKTATVKIRTTR
jgi:hypothetical protein